MDWLQFGSYQSLIKLKMFRQGLHIKKKMQSLYSTSRLNNKQSQMQFLASLEVKVCKASAIASSS